MDPRRNTPHVSQGDNKANGSMATHMQVASVIEEDHSGGARLIGRLAKQSSDQNVRASWFQDNACPDVVEVVTKPLKPLAKRSAA